MSDCNEHLLTTNCWCQPIVDGSALKHRTARPFMPPQERCGLMNCTKEHGHYGDHGN